MNDKSLYTQILGILPPWEVSDVELNLLDTEVKIRIIYTSKKGTCPDCGKEYSVHDYREERSWRHLDTCQMITTISSKLPRIKCASHGVKTVNTPWSDSNAVNLRELNQFSNIKCGYLQDSFGKAILSFCL